jgi:NAD(P)-dependent dehydrogenase (short-subunit alcohol dehydrogenase family)
MTTMTFDGLGAVVTGGAGALGNSVVRRLLEAGARVAAPTLTDEEAAGFALRDHERVLLRPRVDLTDEGQVDEFFNAAADFCGGRIWASVHCAGGFAMAPIADTGARAFDAMMRINALSCLLCCRAAVAHMHPAPPGSPHEGGRIVNVAAKPALAPHEGKGMIAYAASKAAVAAITLALAEEVKGERIWVNAVVPSVMDTPANRRAMPQADHQAWPAVDQVARTIEFLASPSNHVTRGALVPVYGVT